MKREGDIGRGIWREIGERKSDMGREEEREKDRDRE